MKNNDHKKIVITGGADGIGNHLVRIYLKRGYSVAVIDFNEDKLRLLALEFAAGGKLYTFTCDVSNRNQFEEVTEKIRTEFGRPDIWINNAGITKNGSIDKISATDFDRVMNVNVGGVINGTRAALSLMKEPERGIIANVSSMAGIVALPHLTAYSTSKFAVTGFTRALRAEKKLAQSALTISLICPGFVRTSIMNPENGVEVPKWADFLISTPEAASMQIVAGLDSRSEDIYPSLNGKALRVMDRIAPFFEQSLFRALSSKNLKEFLGVKPINR